MMANLAFLAEQVITQKLSGRQIQSMRHSDVSYSIAIATVFFVVVGLGLLVLASYLWLSEAYTTDIAAALTGFIALMVASIMAIFMLTLMHYKQRSIRKMRDEIKHSLQDVVESIDEIIADPVKENPKIAAISAVILGFALGEKTF
jgi:hypothetical protein